jgi:hypothetical protein
MNSKDAISLAEQQWEGMMEDEVMRRVSLFKRYKCSSQDIKTVLKQSMKKWKRCYSLFQSRKLELVNLTSFVDVYMIKFPYWANVFVVVRKPLLKPSILAIFQTAYQNWPKFV